MLKDSESKTDRIDAEGGDPAPKAENQGSETVKTEAQNAEIGTITPPENTVTVVSQPAQPEEITLKHKKAVTLETFVFLAIFLAIFIVMGKIMGTANMFNTLMNTAHDLLLNVVFFIMAIAVVAGAISALLSEFGVVALANQLISVLIRPIYDLPGAASLGIVTTYLSDNPAIITLANDEGFKKYFKNYELPTLCNLGTSFGMGFLLTTFMAGLGDKGEYIGAALVGNLGAIAGSVVSVRIMSIFTRKYYGITKEQRKQKKVEANMNRRIVRNGTTFERVLDAILEGGKSGVDMGMQIIPGVIVICTMVMMLTFGPSEVVDGVAVYTGAKKEGIALFPLIGEWLSPVLKPLFGFNSAEAISFPVTSLGSVGAAMGLAKDFVGRGIVTANDIAVFTAMGMCWSGYLSTHVGMMDALGVRQLTSRAIISHTVGGLVAGVAAHLLCMAFGIA